MASFPNALISGITRSEVHCGDQSHERDRPTSSNVEGATPAEPRGWSLYGAPWLQPVAISGKSTRPQNREDKPKPLPPAATGCVRGSMVSRASAVDCQPLREVPS